MRSASVMICSKSFRVLKTLSRDVASDLSGKDAPSIMSDSGGRLDGTGSKEGGQVLQCCVSRDVGECCCAPQSWRLAALKCLCSSLCMPLPKTHHYHVLVLQTINTVRRILASEIIPITSSFLTS
jgi:hypothetical protein